MADSNNSIQPALPSTEGFSSSKGEIKVWLTAAGLTLGLLMIGGLLALIAWNGFSVFWPRTVTQFTLMAEDGSTTQVAGFVTKRQTRSDYASNTQVEELQVFTGNRDAYGLAFRFFDGSTIQDSTQPPDIIMAERTEYGRALFFPVHLELEEGLVIQANDPTFEEQMERLVEQGNERRREIRHLEKGAIGSVNARLRKLELRAAKITAGDEKIGIEDTISKLKSEFEELASASAALRQRQTLEKLTYRLASGEERSLPIADIMHFYHPNRLSFAERVGIFLHHILAFLTEEPREANTEGGIFPAIFGTFVMTVLMAAMVTPLGVVAAIYLHEYARQGFLVQIVRICVNNLAGVPSIVFGVFGLGFFIYGVGGFIDGGSRHPLPERWWFLIAIGALVSIAAAVLISARNRSATPLRRPSRLMTLSESVLWLGAMGLLVATLAKSPYFSGFFNDALPSPTFGTGGILWASLTLALMTLPVVIVATEEALSAVSRGVREAALACGASKWQMIQRIALPGALPGVMTGVILAMARGAGEVAPLMITGVVKLAPSLPLDTTPPFIHAERKFMHLGFHIFDLGFQSPDSEAAKPMVFATTLLLVTLVVVLNLAAIQLRTHLRRKYQASAF